MIVPFVVWKFYTNQIAIWFSTVLWIESSTPTGENLRWKLKKNWNGFKEALRTHCNTHCALQGMGVVIFSLWKNSWNLKL